MASCCLYLFLASLFVVLSLSSSLWIASILAPNSVESFRKNHRNEAYVFFNNSETNFQEANKICSHVGSLAVVRDQHDQWFLQKWLKGEYFWLGARYSPSSSRLIWQEILDGKYSNWEPDEPGCHSKCCALLMNPQGKWMTYPCSQKVRLLCRLRDDLVSRGTRKNSNEYFLVALVSLKILMVYLMRGQMN